MTKKMTQDNDEPGELQIASMVEGANRESDLVLDREGMWHHQGQPVTHQRLAAALHRWLDRDDETGRYILKAGEQWCFINVEDVPFQVLRVTIAPRGLNTEINLELSDGSKEELSYGSLEQRRDDSLCCTVKGGRFVARFSRTAAFALGQHVELDGDDLTLQAGGRSWTVHLSS